MADCYNNSEEIVITKHGKPYILLKSYNNSKVGDVKVRTIPVKVITKSEVIEGLRQKTQEIILKEEPGVEEVKHSCAVCKKLFRRDREAVEEIELLSNDVYRKDWVCQEHKAKYALC